MSSVNTNQQIYLSYKIVLFVFDLVSCVISCYLASLLISFFQAGNLSVDLNCCILTASFLSFFPVYGLYDYHNIFKLSRHIVGLVKSYIWLLFSLVFIVVICSNSIYVLQYSVSSILLLFVAFLFAVLGRFLSVYFGHFVLSIGISFIIVGFLIFVNNHIFPALIYDIDVLFFLSFVNLIVVCLVRLFLVHVVFAKWFRRFFRRQVVIVGDSIFNAGLINYVIDQNAPYWISGIVSIEPINLKDKKLENDSYFKQILGSLKELPLIIKKYKINELIVTDQNLNKKELIALLDFAVSKGLVTWFPPSLLPIIPMKLKIDNFCSIPMIRMCLQTSPTFFKWIKRIFDIIFSLLLIIIFSPVFLIIAIAIKLDSEGPVFYKATMVGEDGKQFKMLKFRSMKIDTDSSIHKNFVSKFIKGEMDRSQKPVLKITNDPRVTRVGRIIRRLSLDELPQLFNVLKGDMSLVGPRPCLPYEYELYKDWHKKRNTVKPGITGLWQIAGRSEVSFEEMILLDLYYIYNRNILMDLSILFETIFVVLGMKGAY